jgi:hypothetical protein
MLTGLIKHANKLKFLINDNSTTILTTAGVAGTVATAYLTACASFKAAKVIRNEEIWTDLDDDKEEHDEVKPLTTTKKVKLTWTFYIPAVGVGAATIASIIFANKISSKQIAALTVASGISERALKEYKDKVVEKLGPNKDRDIRDSVAQDRVTNNPPGSREVILAGTGEVLCFDMGSGRYFQSTVEEIKRAENKINYELIHSMSASLSEFYGEIGLAPTSYSDSVGWNTNNHLEVLFSTVLSPDGRPCLAIDFSLQPRADYDRLYD